MRRRLDKKVTQDTRDISPILPCEERDNHGGDKGYRTTAVFVEQAEQPCNGINNLSMLKKKNNTKTTMKQVRSGRTVTTTVFNINYGIISCA